MRFDYIDILLFTLLLFFSCKQKKSDCSRFHTGKFSYHGSVTKQNYVVERNDSIQTELVVETGTVLKFRIEWTGPCSYELQFIAVEKAGTDPSILTRKFLPIRTMILTTAKDYYVYKTVTSIAGPEYSDTMKVMSGN